MPSQTSNENDWDDVLARFERHQTARRIGPNASSPNPTDPWEILLKRVEKRTGAIQAVDRDGKLEWRVKSHHLLTQVIGIPPERTTNAHTIRLGIIMRRLGWDGPKMLWFGDKAKGYTKPNSSDGSLRTKKATPEVETTGILIPSR